MANVYTAVKTYHPEYDELCGHITTSFTELSKDTPKIMLFNNGSTLGKVTHIEYFPTGNVTVAIIDSERVNEIHADKLKMGLSYQLEFKPHITIGKGNHVDDHRHLVGAIVSIGYEYIGFV